MGIASYVKRHLDSLIVSMEFHDTSVDSPMKKMADVSDNRYLRTDGMQTWLPSSISSGRDITNTIGLSSGRSGK